MVRPIPFRYEPADALVFGGALAYLGSVSFAQLNYFVAVAEEQHLTRAAQRLHISQPPLSRQIRALEEELGVPLFARTPQGMTLLPTGERLLIEVRRILDSIRGLKPLVGGVPLTKE